MAPTKTRQVKLKDQRSSGPQLANAIHDPKSDTKTAAVETEHWQPHHSKSLKIHSHIEGDAVGGLSAA
jgi:hypothetical protein